MLACLGPHMQQGYVVRDARAAMAEWGRSFGVGPFLFRAEVLLDRAWFRGRPINLRMAVGLAFRGDTMIEIIEPLDGTLSPFTEFLAAGREGLHHFGFWPADIEAAARECEAHGLLLDYQAQVTGKHPTLFFRAPPATGMMIELIEGSDAKLASYEPIRRIAGSWRPGDPSWLDAASDSWEQALTDGGG